VTGDAQPPKDTFGLSSQRRLVRCGQAQHGAGHRRRRVDLRLQRAEPDGDVRLGVVSGQVDVADDRDEARADELEA
jgi:hypothetical protein